VKGTTYEIKAIPTMYDGVMMRSRLEARWAAFLSACGWQWNYEPIDLDGWCPDFVLNFGPRKVYVEVKPQINESTMDEMKRVSKPLTGAGHRVILVGESIDYSHGEAIIGWGADTIEKGEDTFWDEIVIGCCGARTSRCWIGMSSRGMSYDCIVCGEYDGNPANDYEAAKIKERWALACNRTQWKR